jgi:hypothetical protein
MIQYWYDGHREIDISEELADWMEKKAKEHKLKVERTPEALKVWHKEEE